MQWRTPIDTGEKLDSSLALRYLWFNWRIIGIHPTQLCPFLYYIYAVLMYFLFAAGMSASLLFQLYFLEGWEQTVGNLWLSLTFLTSTVKQTAIMVQRHKLLKANTHLKKLDERCNEHSVDRRYILNTVNQCHRLYIYVFFYIFIAVGFSYIGLRNSQLIFNAWFPPLLSEPFSQFLLAASYQELGLLFCALQNATNDMYPPCYLAVMIAHLRALAARIERIGKQPQKSMDENLAELLNCIEDHKNILRYFECIRPVISSTILLQFVITAFVLCLTAINFIAFQRDTLQLLFTAVFQVAIFLEGFPCCWFVNSMLEESEHLTTAMYSCDWYSQNQKFRKTLIIFMQRSQKTNVIIAGNLVPATLQTFLAIIRFSFSMYTILSKMNV